MIPQAHSTAVSRALQDAFGTMAMDDIQPIDKGLSSDLVFRIIVQGKPFLLKIMTSINERNAPDRIFAVMRAAADAGLAPRVWYASVEDGISITGFIETVPQSLATAREHIPRAIRSLHALPAFPQTFNFATMHNYFIWRFRNGSVLPREELRPVFDTYGRLCATYVRLDEDMVPSHCDLKPENMLFDGRQVWLVDWQAAFMNDRYFDLAVVANFLVSTAADERAYLTDYFGHPPDEYQAARFCLMRQIMHVFYASTFLVLGSGGQPLEDGGALPSFRNFHDQMWAGGVDLGSNEMKLTYGRIHWKQLISNLAEPRFEEALRIVSQRHTDQSNSARLLPDTPPWPEVP